MDSSLNDTMSFSNFDSDRGKDSEMTEAEEGQRNFKHKLITASDGICVTITLDNEEVLRVCIDYEDEDVSIYPDLSSPYSGIRYAFNGEYKDG